MAEAEANDTDDNADKFHLREVDLSLKSSIVCSGNMGDCQHENEENNSYGYCWDRIAQKDRTGERLFESYKNILVSPVKDTGSCLPKLTASNIPCEMKAEKCTIDEWIEVNMDKFKVLPKKVPYDHGLTNKRIKNKKKSAIKEGTNTKKEWKNLALEDIGIYPTLFPRPIPADTTRDMIQEYDRFVEADFNEIEEIITNKSDFEVYESLTMECIRADRHQKIRKAGRQFTSEADFDVYESLTIKPIRADRHQKIRKVDRQAKDKYCRSVNNSNGKRFYIYPRTFKLIALDPPRLHFMPKPKSKKTKACIKVKRAKSYSTTRKKARLKKIRGKPKPPSAVGTRHALHSKNLPLFIASEQGLADLLISLQHRNLSPADYELLLRLDEQVAPQTVSNQTLSGFKTEQVTEAECGEYCAICMEVYTMGQKFKYLPCEHRFHSSCIDMWLQNSSLNCPLDGLPVDQ